MDLSNLTHESEELPHVFKEQLTHPILLGFWSQKKEVALPWVPPLGLTGVQTSCWEHPILVPNCSS